MAASGNHSFAPERLFFFDNLRCFVVLLAVVAHCALSYMKMCTWWFVRDARSADILFYFVFICDIFMMPLLFFVSGYFAFSSLERSGILGFLRKKVVRLGLPYTLGITLVSAWPVYLRQKMRISGESSPYRDFWLGYLKSVDSTEVHIPGLSPDMVVNVYWYLGLLLVFCVLLCPVYYLLKTVLAGPESNTLTKKPTRNNTLAALAVVWLLTSAVYFGVSQFSTLAWVTWGDVVQIQLPRVPLYACYFAFGAYAYRKRWFVDGRLPQSSGVWMLICLFALITYFFFAKDLLSSTSLSTASLLGMSVSRMLVCIASLVVCTSLAYRYLNHGNGFNRNLASNSYNVYLAHFVIVVMLQWLVLPLNMPALAKFSIVSVMALALSYAVSQFMMKRSMVLTACGLIAVHLAMCIWVK